MIKHVLMWNVQNIKDKSKNETINEAAKLLESLKTNVPGILALEVGINITESSRAKDIFFYTEFADEQALSTYQDHPEHLKVVAKLKQLVEAGSVVDYLV
ncbi:MAG: Dabb family protein [Candidatus Omnitrophica bacterium]|nr:Dabb family protein [Candidatus Omnitrophota bacterium]